MTADEFLALVEKRPLPWRLTDDSNLTPFFVDSSEAYVPTPLGLADAAPAIAVAAIRLLRDFPPEAPWRAANLRNLLAAHLVQIRDALPEELRT